MLRREKIMSCQFGGWKQVLTTKKHTSLISVQKPPSLKMSIRNCPCAGQQSFEGSSPVGPPVAPRRHCALLVILVYDLIDSNMSDVLTNLFITMNLSV